MQWQPSVVAVFLLATQLQICLYDASCFQSLSIECGDRPLHENGDRPPPPAVETKKKKKEVLSNIFVFFKNGTTLQNDNSSEPISNFIFPHPQIKRAVGCGAEGCHV